MTDSQGPFVHVATFCRDVIEQADHAVTLVGVTRHAVIEPDESGERIADLKVFMSLAAGTLEGKHEIVVRPTDPDGETPFEEGAFTMLFEPGTGVVLEAGLRFEVFKEGRYWFDVLLNGERLLTRIPLRIEFASGSNGYLDEV
jgi:Family of unknown function (DUF6941)